MILSDKSSSRRDERLSRNPSGKADRRFFASFNRVNAGISSNVPGLRLSRPQFAHSKRVMLLNENSRLLYIYRLIYLILKIKRQ